LPGEDAFIEHDELHQVQDSSCADVIPSTMEALESAPDGIQLIYHNVQGPLSKSAEIVHWLHVCQALPTILCYTETWPKKDSFALAMERFSEFYSPLLWRPDCQFQ